MGTKNKLATSYQQASKGGSIGNRLGRGNRI